MLEGLQLYEVVLLFAGTLLFLVLLFALVLFIVRRRSLKGLLAFFPIAIVMMGFPGISKISFDNGKIEVEKQTGKLAQNPHDPATRQQLAEAVKRMELRPISSAGTFASLAEANAALGNTNAALRYVEKTLALQPQSSVALRLRESLMRVEPTPAKTVTHPVTVNTNLLEKRRIIRVPNP
jgi:hypothetical protein